MFERLKLLVGDENLEKISNIKVLLVGLGGVGGACFEALLRMGIRKIAVVDNDIFDISNLNRQLLATFNTIGHSKVNEAVLRAKTIHPDISVIPYEMFLDESNFDEMPLSV